MRRLERSLSWPSPYLPTEHPRMPSTKESKSFPATEERSSSHDAFLHDLDNHPDQHFLTPIEMYDAEDWASDSEDEEDIEWDAGITDFALFD